MKDISKVSPGYYHSKECNLADFQKIIDQNLAIDAVPNAKEIQNNIQILIMEFRTNNDDDNLINFNEKRRDLLINSSHRPVSIDI